MRHNFRGDRRFERGFMEIDDALKDGTTLSDFSRIAKRSIRKYCKEKNVQILQLKDNFESLLDFVEEDSGAPRRFQNKDQFRSFLKVMVATL